MKSNIETIFGNAGNLHVPWVNTVVPFQSVFWWMNFGGGGESFSPMQYYRFQMAYAISLSLSLAPAPSLSAPLRSSECPQHFDDFNISVQRVFIYIEMMLSTEKGFCDAYETWTGCCCCCPIGRGQPAPIREKMKKKKKLNRLMSNLRKGNGPFEAIQNVLLNIKLEQISI